MTTSRTVRWAIGLVIGTGILLAACGSAGAENAGTDVDVTSTIAGSDTTASDQDTQTTTTAGSDDAAASGDTADVPDDVPFPIPSGGSVFSYLDDPTEPVLVMNYEGDRADEFVASYEDWIADEPSVSGSATDTGVGALFTVKIDGNFGGIINVSTATTEDVTGIQLGWSRGGDAEQGDAAVGGDADTAGDTPVMAAADLPADPPAPFPAGGEVNKFGELEAGYSLTLMYKGTRRKEFVDFYESWAADVGAETTSSEDGPLGHAFEFELDGQPAIVDVTGGEPPAGLTMVTVLWGRP